jgi:hypothetical protein
MTATGKLGPGVTFLFLLWAGLQESRLARAEAPSCFPERTVLWAVPLVDAQGKSYGGIRAGHQVRILDDFIGPDHDQALIENDHPIHVRAVVSRGYLVAFTREQLDLVAGFARWSAGVPVTVGKMEGTKIRLYLADPHFPPDRSPSTDSQCSLIRGAPIAIASRDECHGATPVTTARTHGRRQVFWKDKTPLKSPNGPESVTIPAKKWVSLVRRGRESSLVEYRDYWKTMYLGNAPTAGMQNVPKGSGVIDLGHMCCEGWLIFDPVVPVDDGRESIILSPAPLRPDRDGQPVVTLDKGCRVRVMDEMGDSAFVGYRWPPSEHDDFTFQVHGWIDRKALDLAVAQPPPRDSGTADAVQQGVERDGRCAPAR